MKEKCSLCSGKKISFVFFFPIFLILLTTIAVSAENYVANPINEFDYDVFEDHIEIHRYIGSQLTIVVPDTIEGKPVTVVRLGKSDYEEAPQFYEYVKKIVLPASVVKLDNDCFAWFTLLNEIVGLENVQELGENIFNRTSSLKTIHFSEKLKNINQLAFSGSFLGLESLWIPDDLEISEHYSFFPGADSLKEVRLIPGTGEQKLTIREHMLFSADGKILYTIFPTHLNSLCIIPDGTEVIGGSSLSNNRFITDFILPASIQTVMNSDFFSETLVYHVYPNSVIQSLLEAYNNDGHNIKILVIGETEEEGIDEMVSRIVSETVTDNMSDYEKVKALHDWLCNHAEYDYNLEKYTAYEILSTGSGVCEAYSRAYCLLLNKAGIESRVISCSIIDGGAHALNGVKINGRWYLVDVTNDDVVPGEIGYELFCFDERLFNSFYTGSLPVKADDISLYPAVSSGMLDPLIDELTIAIQDHLEAGENAFSIETSTIIPSARPGLYESAVCSYLQQTEWNVGGNTYLIECDVSDNRTLYSFVCTYDTNDDYLYEVNGNKVYIKAYTGMDASIHVPTEIEGMPVVSVGNTFRQNNSIQEVYLPDGITEISDYAFYQCSSLEKIHLPSVLLSIGNYAFAECYSLRQDLVLPLGLQTIGAYAFASCGSLQRISIPGTVTDIGDRVFYGCSLLNDVTLGEGIISISESMFFGCKELKHILLPNSIETIREGAFVKSGLISLNIPSNTCSIHWGAFAILPNFVRLTVSENNMYYSAENNILFSRDKTILYMAVGQTPQSYTIPSGIETIKQYAFGLNESTLSIRIPSTVRSIESFAFSHSQLKYIEIDEGITEIGDYAFCTSGTLAPCTLIGIWRAGGNIESIHLPASVTSIGTGAFLGNRTLKELIIPPRVTTIPENIIDYPQILVIPNNVTQIGSQNITNNYKTNCNYNQVIIHGYTGSAAESFALNHGFQFIELVDSGLFVMAQRTDLLPGEYTDLTVSCAGSDGIVHVEDCTWDINPLIAEIKDGKLCAVSPGDAVVKATFGNSSASFSIHIYNVTPEDSPRFEILGADSPWVGEDFTIYVYLTVHEPTEDGNDAFSMSLDARCKWYVSDPTVVELTQYGHGYCIGPGISTITAELPDGRRIETMVKVKGTALRDDLVAKQILSATSSQLHLPASIKSIEDEALMGTNTQAIIIPEGCTSIGASAFANSSALSVVVIPASIRMIDNSAFENCDDVTLIVHNEYGVEYAIRNNLTFLDVK